MLIFLKNIFYTTFFLSIISYFLASCGFKVEGLYSDQQIGLSTFIQTNDTSSYLYNSLNEIFFRNSSLLVSNLSSSEAVLTIVDDFSDQRMLSVSAGNIPREYEVFYSITYSYRTGDKLIIPEETIFLSESYTFDERFVLGKDREKESLIAKLSDDLARQVYSRILINIKSNNTPSL